MEIILLVLSKLSQTQFFLPYNKKTPRNVSKKLIKLKKKIQFKKLKNKLKIKECNSFSLKKKKQEYNSKWNKVGIYIYIYFFFGWLAVSHNNIQEKIKT